MSLPAGGLRLHAGPSEALYQAEIVHCARHTAPTATLAPPAAPDGFAGRLTLSLDARPGVFVGFGGERNTMTLDLTPARPQALDLDLGEGESVIDLTGIPVRRLRVVGGAGDARVIFGKPNPEAAEGVSIEATVGDVGIDLLGNAGAAEVTVTGGVGALEVDLGGSWRRDAEVMIQASVGDLVLKLPSGATPPGVRLAVGEPWRRRLTLAGYARRGEDFYSDGYDAAAPKLDVTILPGIGKMAVERDDAHEDMRRQGHEPL